MRIILAKGGIMSNKRFMLHSVVLAVLNMVKIIIGVFASVVAVWGVASLYFTVTGRDAPGDSICEYLPPRFDLSPEENAYTAIKIFCDNIPTNNATPLATNYHLRKAFLDGETNRLALASAVRDYLAAETATITAAKGILASRGIVVEQDEVIDAAGRICTLMRIGNIYKVKAVYEASNVDLETGRASLMELYRVGRFLMDSDSLVYGLSALIGDALCKTALYTAAKEPFAPEEDESWRVHLRNLMRNLMADDADRWKRIARRSFAGYTRMKVGAAAKDRKKFLAVQDGKMLGVLLACPGYASYCFQPNRILQAHRAEVDRFCRKVDEGGYDMSYARERHAGSTARKAGFGPLTRNFLGQKMMPGRDDSYAKLFEMRFKSRAFIAALACRSYHAKYGKLPDCLDALVPEFLDEAPLDPYDGEKLRWNAEKGYFWTKGRDGDFNGVVEFGSDGKPRWKNRTYHWVQFLDTLIPLF